MLSTLLILKPLADVLMTTIIAPAVGFYLVYLAQKYLGIKIDSKRQDDLQSAITTGWKRALAEDWDNPSITTVIDHVEKIGAPEAVKHFDLSVKDIANLAETKKVTARQAWLKDAS